jgi:serine/threonine protein kinase
MPLPACTAGTAVLPVLLYCLWVCRVSEALARFLFQQLVLALSFCHGRGVVCRGLKLANTLLALAPGQLPLLKLGDFSVSKDTARHSAPASQVWPEDGMMKTHTHSQLTCTHTLSTQTRGVLTPPYTPYISLSYASLLLVHRLVQRCLFHQR